LAGAGSLFHPGLDYRAAAGTPLVAQYNGTILDIDPAGGLNTVVIKPDGEKFQFAYVHLFPSSQTGTTKVGNGFKWTTVHFKVRRDPRNPRSPVVDSACSGIMVLTEPRRLLVKQACKRDPIKGATWRDKEDGQTYRVTHQVVRGETFAPVGDAGANGNPHLHLGIRDAAKRKNPLDRLTPRASVNPVVTLPYAHFTREDISLGVTALKVTVTSPGLDLEKINFQITDPSGQPVVFDATSTTDGRYEVNFCGTLACNGRSHNISPGSYPPEVRPITLNPSYCDVKTTLSVFSICVDRWKLETGAIKSYDFYLPIGVKNLNPGTYTVLTTVTTIAGAITIPDSFNVDPPPVDGGFWQGAYTVTQCNEPGSIVPNACRWATSGWAGSIDRGGAVMLARLGTSESANIRWEQSSGVSICQAQTTSLGTLPVGSTFSRTLDMTGILLPYTNGKQSSTITFTTTFRTLTEIRGTFVMTYAYPIGQTPGAFPSANGTATGTWQLQPRGISFPKCIYPPEGQWCRSDGKAWSSTGADTQQGGIGAFGSCPWKARDEAGRANEWAP
jgi:hypothetical protein